jgi:hypothetical protein
VSENSTYWWLLVGLPEINTFIIISYSTFIKMLYKIRLRMYTPESSSAVVWFLEFSFSLEQKIVIWGGLMLQIMTECFSKFNKTSYLPSFLVSGWKYKKGNINQLYNGFVFVYIIHRNWITRHWRIIIVHGGPMFVDFMAHSYPHPRISIPTNLFSFLININIHVVLCKNQVQESTNEIKSPRTSRIVVTHAHLPPRIKMIPPYSSVKDWLTNRTIKQLLTNHVYIFTQPTSIKQHNKPLQ